MSDKQFEVFEQRAQVVLRESAEQLDGATRSRLTQARHAALEVIRQRRSKPWMRFMPAAGVAAAAVLMLMLVVNPARQRLEPAPAVDEFEILAAEDSLEFYRDVEFYAWLGTVLDQEAAPEGGV